MKLFIKALILSLLLLVILPVSLGEINIPQNLKSIITYRLFPLLTVLIFVWACYETTLILMNKLRKNTGQKDDRTKPLKDKTSSAKDNFNLPDEMSIVKYFMDLYKLQLGTTNNALSQIRPIETSSFDPKGVYELRVKLQMDWTSRRMSINPIGEDTASRSRCYEVIYDDRLVVKIPPQPIRGFYEYIEKIKRDEFITAKLNLKGSIVPNVSVILKRIHEFPYSTDMAIEQLEERYIQWVGETSSFQKHLMILDTFVFFMDLSQHKFLSNIIENMHNIEKKMHKEITGYPEIIFNTRDFEGRYGENTSQICVDIQNVYSKCEKAVRHRLSTTETSSSINEYQIRNWFLAHLAKGDVEKDERGLTEELVDEINTILDRIIKEDVTPVEVYLKMVEKNLQRKTLQQSRSHMMGIISNLLELLAWLGHKKVAIRDLKPDNLLIAGDQEQFPQFLSTPEKFSIGLIDVETAVDFEPGGDDPIIEPLLGGTPFYSTPSHLFTNGLLLQIFEDISLIFHLQDWHAIVAMIYKIITGDPLFEKTGQLIPTIKKILQTSSEDARLLPDVAKKVSQMFWSNCYFEFKEKIDKKSKQLNQVKIPVLYNTMKMLKENVIYERQNVDKAINRHINSQTIFQKKDDKERLSMATHKQIRPLKKKWENVEPGTSGAEAKQNRAAVKILQNLEQLKLRSEQTKHILSMLEQSSPKIPAGELIQCMFNIVLSSMYLEKWGALTGNATSIDALAEYSSYEVTI